MEDQRRCLRGKGIVGLGFGVREALMVFYSLVFELVVPFWGFCGVLEVFGLGYGLRVGF